MPDIVLGRISVQTAVDCANIADKILAFDRYPDSSSWHGDFLMAALLQDYDDGNCRADRWFFETGTHAMHFVEDQIGMGIYTAATSDSMSCNPYYYRSDSYPHRFPGYAGQTVPVEDAALITNGSTATQDVTDAINAGVSIVQHRDHGGVTGWGDPHYSISDINGLSNGTKTPVVFSINCLTGTFNYSSDCFAEAFMKKYPGGAVGVIAATDVSYSGYNDLLVHGAYDCFWDDYDTGDGGNPYPHSFRPAEALMYGKYYMYNWEGSGSMTQLEFELFHWHGDPEMMVTTDSLVTPTVAADPTIPVGVVELSVTCDTDGALVAVTDGGTLLGRALVAGGVATVSLSPAPPAPTTLDVVVTGHNLMPWEGTTEVIVPEGPWMIYESHILDDSPGNGDGILNPGESVVLPVTLHNVGADDGTGITAILSADPAHCTVTDPAASFPDAAIGQSVPSLPDHFSFTVLPAVPHGQMLLFSIDWAADGGYSGNTGLAIPVCHPLLISDVAVSAVGDESAVITWTTNVPATSRVIYGTVVPPVAVVESPGLVTNHSVELTGLAQCTDYVFAVLSSSPGCYTTADDNAGGYYGFTTTAGTPVVVDSTDTPLPIPDSNPTGVRSAVSVTSPYDVLDVDVLVNITHTYDGDLDIELIGPNGVSVELTSDNGGTGENFIDTLFDDEAAQSITEGSAPFTGSYRPEQPLSTLDGIPAAGNWTLWVVDDAGVDLGTLNSWQLQLKVNEPCANVFTDGFESGNCSRWSDMRP